MAQHRALRPARRAGRVDDAAVVPGALGNPGKRSCRSCADFRERDLPAVRAPRLLQRFLHGETFPYDQQPDARVTDDEGHFPRDQLEIDRHDDSACTDDGQIGQDEFQAVLAEEPDLVARTDPLLLKHSRPAVHKTAELPVCHMTLLIDDSLRCIGMIGINISK